MSSYITMDLRAQREYVRCHKMGVGFSAHENYWYYNWPTHYNVTEPDGPLVLKILKSEEDLGIDWITKLKERSK